MFAYIKHCLDNKMTKHYYPSTLVCCSYDSLLRMFSECGHILGLRKLYYLFHLTFASEAFPLRFDITF